MAFHNNPKLITDDLCLCVDAADLNSSAHLNQTNLVTNVHTTVSTSTAEEMVVSGRDPWGRIALIDRSEGNDVGSNYDGGYTTSIYDGIDRGEKYRFTYFFRVDNKGSDGRLYFGLYAYNASNQNVGVYDSGGSSSTTNPYFSYPMHYDADFEEGRWYMFVAYVHPEGTSSASDSTAGYYDMLTKTKISESQAGNVHHNAVWVNMTTKALARFYLYYSTDPEVGMSWLMPRIEQVDGNEPSITEMLNSPQDRLSNLVNDGRMFYPRGGATSMEHTYKSIALGGSASQAAYLDMGADHDFKTSGGWTVSTWIKYDTVPGSYDNTIAPGNFIGAESINYSSWYWSVLSSKLALWDMSPGSVWKYGATTLSSNKWYHATLVSDVSNNAYYCYLNGENDMSSDWSSYNGSWQTSRSGLRIRYIGRGSSGNPRRVDGNIACTHAWTRALTAAEIKQNFNAQRDRFRV